MEEKVIETVVEEVVKVAEESVSTPVVMKGFGKKVTISTLALIVLGGAAKIGYDYFKKAKKAKEVEAVNEDTEENFEDVEDLDSEDTIE